MSDIKLFRTNCNPVVELEASAARIEKDLQTLLERHMEVILGVMFLETEYSTGKTHGGRIDSLGIDENHCPVIIEYKRHRDENVINQGLFYLDWLMDHQAEFELLVLRKFGQEIADQIDWSSPRLLCIANDFTKYDEHAVQQINRNIELLRYRQYGDELVLLELVNAVTATTTSIAPSTAPNGGGPNRYKTVSDYYEQSPPSLRAIYDALEAFVMSLGDDVQKKTLKYYYAFKRIKNFACVEIHPSTSVVVAFCKTPLESITFEAGFTRDVSAVGHYGTGDLEITLRSLDDLERAKPFLEASYEVS